MTNPAPQSKRGGPPHAKRHRLTHPPAWLRSGEGKRCSGCYPGVPRAAEEGPPRTPGEVPAKQTSPSLNQAISVTCSTAARSREHCLSSPRHVGPSCASRDPSQHCASGRNEPQLQGEDGLGREDVRPAPPAAVPSTIPLYLPPYWGLQSAPVPTTHSSHDCSARHCSLLPPPSTWSLSLETKPDCANALGLFLPTGGGSTYLHTQPHAAASACYGGQLTCIFPECTTGSTATAHPPASPRSHGTTDQLETFLHRCVVPAQRAKLFFSSCFSMLLPHRGCMD